MILIPNKTLVKYNDVGQVNPTIEPFRHYHNEVYMYLGKIPLREGMAESYRSQFIRVRRLKDQHDFVMFKSSFVELTAKTTKKKYNG